MNISINLDGKVTPEDSFQLTQLADLIERECDLVLELQPQDSHKGVKDGGLIVAIVGIGLSIVSTFISVLSYWKSEHPRYSMTVTHGNSTFSIDNMTLEAFQSMIAKMEIERPSTDFKVLISKK